MKRLLFLLVLSLCFSCEKQDVTIESGMVNTIDVEEIHFENTRSEVIQNDCWFGYLCTSETSSLISEIYPSLDETESYSYIVDKQGNVSHLIKFKIDSFVSEGICKFTAYNEKGEPIMSGVYDTVNSQMEITNIFDNVIETRASVAAWGCGLALGVVGGMWSTAAGMVSAGAGFIVGLSYTAMAIAMCDGL